MLPGVTRPVWIGVLRILVLQLCNPIWNRHSDLLTPHPHRTRVARNRKNGKCSIVCFCCCFSLLAVWTPSLATGSSIVCVMSWRRYVTCPVWMGRQGGLLFLWTHHWCLRLASSSQQPIRAQEDTEFYGPLLTNKSEHTCSKIRTQAMSSSWPLVHTEPLKRNITSASRSAKNGSNCCQGGSSHRKLKSKQQIMEEEPIFALRCITRVHQ